MLIEFDGHVLIEDDCGGKCVRPLTVTSYVNKTPVLLPATWTKLTPSQRWTHVNVRLGLRNHLAHAALEHIRARLSAEIRPVE